MLLDGQPIGAIAPARLAERAVMLQSSRVAFPFTGFEVVRLGTEGIGAGLSRKDRDDWLCPRCRTSTPPGSRTAIFRRYRAASSSASILHGPWRS